MSTAPEHLIEHITSECNRVFRMSPQEVAQTIVNGDMPRTIVSRVAQIERQHKSQTHFERAYGTKNTIAVEFFDIDFEIDAHKALTELANETVDFLTKMRTTYGVYPATPNVN